MIKKKQYYVFLLVFLLHTSSFFATNKIIISPIHDSISLSSKIIPTDNVRIHSEEKSLHTPDEKKSTEQVTLYVHNGTLVYDEDKVISAKIVYLKQPNAVYNRDKKPETKRSIVLKKKLKVINKTASKVFLSNAHSSQNIFCSTTSDLLFYIANSNVFLKNEVVFHYSHLNIHTYSYLEKSRTQESFISSEFFEYFFSRPPPFI